MDNNLKKFQRERLSIKKAFLHEKIFLFIYTLLKNIFIVGKDKNKNNSITNKLYIWIKYINANIIKSPEKYISKEYSIKNLKNILIFTESQNLKYCGDIIEQILIIIFSKAFQTEKDNTINKYIFNHLHLIYEHKNQEFFKWIKKENLNKEEFNDLEKLFDIDGIEDETTLYSLQRQKESIFYNFLRDILKKKYISTLYIYDKRNNKNMFFINDGDCFSYYMTLLIYNKTKIYVRKKKYENEKKTSPKNDEKINLNEVKKEDINNIKNNKIEEIDSPKISKENDNINNITDESDIPILDKDIMKNSIIRIMNNLKEELSDENKPFNQLIRCFFAQVFIYYQNSHSPLINYIYPSDNLSAIPFTYDLQNAVIEGRLAYVVLSPLKVGDFVTNIYLKYNNTRECGLYELGKICAFNNNIKLIECDTCLIRSYYLFFLIEAMGLFDNFSVEEINFTANVFKEDFNDLLIRILKKFKNLKILNLGAVETHKNLGPFFAILKKLYRQKKTKLETLILNKSVLNDSSLYELGELLKCKYCKLKKIYLSNSPIPWNVKFLKKLKYNKSLEELYLSKCEINDSSINDIYKIISFSNIRTFYLPKNKLNNFNNFLRILYRTKIIKKDQKNIKNIINENTALINLDLSGNEFFIKNIYHINLLKKIFQNTSLYCLDMCHILLGINIDKKITDNIYSDYSKGIEDLKTYLIKQKYDYTHTIKVIRKSKKDISKFNYLEKENIKGKDTSKEFIDDINKNENSIYPIFMKKQAKKIIAQENEKNAKEEKYNKKDIDTLANYLMLQNSKFNLKEEEIKENNTRLFII